MKRIAIIAATGVMSAISFACNADIVRLNEKVGATSTGSSQGGASNTCYNNMVAQYWWLNCPAGTGVVLENPSVSCSPVPSSDYKSAWKCTCIAWNADCEPYY